MPQTIAELTDHFALPGVLSFDTHDDLPRAQITLPTCSATVYLHSAHLTHFQPTGHAPVLYLSPTSDFATGKPIRGGIPICFPWFGPDTRGRAGGKPGPSHGFARLLSFTLAFAGLLPSPDGESTDLLHLVFTLSPTALTESLGYPAFRLAYELILGADAGRTLTLRLSVANAGTEALTFEEALHTYFAVDDVRRAPMTGLESALLIDKTDGLREKHAPDTPLTLTHWTDSVFPANRAAVTIADLGNHRALTVEKLNSATTVVWNPYPEASASMADLPADAWPHFLCVETANTGADALTLAPNATHQMQARITLAPTEREAR